MAVKFHQVTVLICSK